MASERDENSDFNFEDENAEEIDNIIEDAAEKLHVDINWLRTISPQEILYLLDRCPFLQITNTEVSLEERSFQLVLSDSGWTIHDYGDAISSSPGELLFGGGDFKVYLGEEEVGNEGNIINPGRGTIRKQAFDTAMQMVELAHHHKWEGIQIVDGHPLMERGAWIKAEELGLRVVGFSPSIRDILVRNALARTPADIEAIIKAMEMRR